MQKPAVIGDVDQQIRVIENESADEIADGVLKANQRRESRIAVGQRENCVVGTTSEIAGHPRVRNCGEKRERMPQRNVFAERHEMDLAINLNLLAAIRDEQRRVVIMSIFEIE